MKISFYKYQGTGNDFVLIDQRQDQFITRSSHKLVEHLCDRRFGIGADGLILLENKAGFDFEMIYFNADGKEGSLCGNGGRCTVAFAKYLGIIQNASHFLAADGPHDARITGTNWVELKMNDVSNIKNGEDHYVLDTGSPHFVTFVEDIDDINVVEAGSQIRYSQRFKDKGINVNFVEEEEEALVIATYERGVENETLSCGTGVTAAALAWYFKDPESARPEVEVKAKGGRLKVRFDPLPEGGFSDIWLCGQAEQVFKGEISIPDRELE